MVDPTPSTEPNNPWDEIRAGLGNESYQRLYEAVQKRLNYPPVIVFMGKTGAGKSSTCNALFGRQEFKVSDVAVGTREVQVEVVPGKLTLMDVPGVGEGGEYSEMYRELYKTILTRGVKDRNGNSYLVDAIVWLVKSNDRALEVDRDFHDGVFKKLCTPDQLARVTYAVTQADAIEPIRGEGSWNDAEHRPGTRQVPNLEEKCRQIATMFDVTADSVVAFSANERFNLDGLLDRIVDTLPAARIPLVVQTARVNEEKARGSGAGGGRVVSGKTAAKAEKAWYDTVLEVAGKVIGEAAVRFVQKEGPKLLKAASKAGLKLLSRLF